MVDSTMEYKYSTVIKGFKSNIALALHKDHVVQFNLIEKISSRLNCLATNNYLIVNDSCHSFTRTT